MILAPIAFWNDACRMKAEPLLLDTVLRPSPPMSARALSTVVGVVALINFAFAFSFVLRGAWPIAPFMGIDVLLLAWALRESRIAARAHERVTLSASRLRVEQQPAKGQSSSVEFNPYWVRVDLQQITEYSNRLFLRSHGRSLQLGSFLAPATRESFAMLLRSALSDAKRADTTTGSEP